MKNKVIVCVKRTTWQIVGFVRLDAFKTLIVHKDIYGCCIDRHGCDRYESVDNIFENHLNDIDKTTYNPYTDKFELREVELIPSDDNWITKIKYYLNRIKDITEIFMNPFNNDAGGSRDCSKLNDKINQELEYFSSMY